MNNAGGQYMTPLEAISAKGWQAVVDTNLTGGFLMARECYLQSMQQHGGAIVNIASVASNWPYAGGNVYGGTKAFVRQFSLGLRSDLQGTGVRVTSIEPGLCESEFTLVRNGGDKAAYDALYGGADPLQPQDIADTVFWVATLPAHVNINSLEIMPVSQSFAGFQIHRKG